MPASTDDRIWRPDLAPFIDWQAIWDQTQVRYSDSPGATWWTQATEGVNYYRAELPARHLPGKTVRFESRDIQLDGEDEPWFPRQEGTAAVWLFSGNTTRMLAMQGLRQLGVRVLLEVDDNYTVPPAIPQLSEWLTTRDSTGGDYASYEANRFIARNACDGIIVSTPELARVYGRLNENVFVCRNSIDPDDWDYEPTHQPDGTLRVGWAGSDSHAYDLADIRPALDWASRQKDVEVVILGGLDIGAIEHRKVPWTDSLAEYRRNLDELDVILCPLRPNRWADAKSDIKALEGAMAGAVPVVSRTEPFRPWWEEDRPCLVADSKKGFVKAVKHLVAHREETRETARLAREYARTSRSIRVSVEDWREAIAG